MSSIIVIVDEKDYRCAWFGNVQILFWCWNMSRFWHISCIGLFKVTQYWQGSRICNKNLKLKPNTLNNKFHKHVLISIRCLKSYTYVEQLFGSLMAKRRQYQTFWKWCLGIHMKHELEWRLINHKRLLGLYD